MTIPTNVIMLPKHFTAGDHFNVNVCSNVQCHLDAALIMAFAEGHAATHYRVVVIDDGRGSVDPIDAAHSLILCSPYDLNAVECLELNPLPFHIDANNAGSFVWEWLKVAQRGKSPNVDGTNRPDAFTVYAGSMYRFKELRWNQNAITMITAGWSVYSK